MTKDPAFLFYPSDASNDTQFMNRLERGAYFDLVKSQRLFRGFTMVQLRKILGKDFEEVWSSLELVLEKEEDQYFIPWVRLSIEKRESYSNKQAERVSKRWENRGITVVIPKKEKENENENVIKYKGMLEKVISENELTLPDGFYDLILEWLKYKSEKKQSYKPTGLKNMIESFIEESASDLTEARKMMKYSMSKNYAGLFKQKKINGNNSESIGRRIKRVNDLWNK